jgi:sugar/nucleoside kinase (ribokinase family)
VLLNPAPALRELDMTYACKCDFFIPNETELEILTGMPVDTYDNIRTAARSLIDNGLNNIIVTMGEKGRTMDDPRTRFTFRRTRSTPLIPAAQAMPLSAVSPTTMSRAAMSKRP